MNLKKTASFGAAALAMNLTGLAAGVPAGASTITETRVDATNYSLSCSALSGKLSFATPLKDPGPAGVPTSMTFKAKATNCTATPPPSGGPALSISKVAVTGTVTIPLDSCPGFADGGALNGAVIYQEKPAHGNSLSSPNTTAINWGDYSTDENGGIIAVLLPGTTVGLTAEQLTGSFMGTDHGMLSNMRAVVDNNFFTQKCASKGGVKSLKFASGSLFLG